ncbi:MAG: hypothetical protein P1P76_08700 [Anaerolineales bacterium]|nr:hypothetical protein [Anaerolineales bacterium]
MNTELNGLMILQSLLAALLMIGVLATLYWLIENPVLNDEEMRDVLEQARSMRSEALRKSRRIARQESERLYH